MADSEKPVVVLEWETENGDVQQAHVREFSLTRGTLTIDKVDAAGKSLGSRTIRGVVLATVTDHPDVTR